MRCIWSKNEICRYLFANSPKYKKVQHKKRIWNLKHSGSNHFSEKTSNFSSCHMFWEAMCLCGWELGLSLGVIVHSIPTAARLLSRMMARDRQAQATWQVIKAPLTSPLFSPLISCSSPVCSPQRTGLWINADLESTILSDLRQGSYLP